MCRFRGAFYVVLAEQAQNVLTVSRSHRGPDKDNSIALASTVAINILYYNNYF